MHYGAHHCTGAAVTATATTAADLAGIIDPHPAAAIGYVLVGGGFALFPDLDSDDSVITRSGGLLTRALGEALQALSRITFRGTRRRCDRGDGGHRYLIHSPWFAMVTGVLLVWGCAALPGTTLTTVDGDLPIPGFGWFVLVMILSASIRALAMELYHGQRVRSRTLYRSRAHTRLGAFLYALAAATGLVLIGGGDLFGWWFGVVAALGMIVHSLGDSVTRSGIPWKWPASHRCDRHRARYLAEGCGWRVRLPWHHCLPCRTARARYPRCARWDRNTIIPHRCTFKAGNAKIENRVSAVCLLITTCMLGIGFTV